MSALKAHEVERFLLRPDVSEGVFLVYGPDAGLVRESAQRLVRQFGGADAGGMNLVTLEGNELDADPGRLAVEAKTASLFGDKHMYGPEGISFYTRGKVVTSRWPDPATSAVDLGFPRTR